MVKFLKKILIYSFFITLLVNKCLATNWYVRPCRWTTWNNSTGHANPTPGTYGSQNGTDYADAWNGIQQIVWGTGGVQTGDQIYICGTHIFAWSLNFPAYADYIMTNMIGVSGITIRMDYPGDPGLMFGGSIDMTISGGVGQGSPYSGPDVNGIYNQTLTGSGSDPPIFYLQFTNGITNIIRLKQRNSSTWTDGLGGQYFNSSTHINYIQTPDGTVPATNNIALGVQGWAFDLNYQNNITFLNCHFIAMNLQSGGLGCIRKVTPASPFTTAATYITFTNCTSFDTSEMFLYPGENNWSLLNCEIARTPSAFYTLINASVTAPQSNTVTHCFIHDIGTPEYTSTDNNAIGIQGGDCGNYSYNTISNSGGAIVLWTGNVNMRTNTISYNFIINTMTNSSGSSSAISLGGDNVLATPGYRYGNQIFGNIIYNTEIVAGDSLSGYAIDLNTTDYTPVYNNTVVGCSRGINWQVVESNCPVNALIANNIIYNASVNPYYIIGQISPTNLFIDNILYYPQTSWVGGGGNGNWELYPTLTGHDAHSVYSSPNFLNSTFQIPWSYKLTKGSSAIQAGTNVNLLQDFAGTLIPTNNPDIGAFQFISYPSSNIRVSKH